ncbi:hypothetical protein UlMin_041191 [Ulmus minor]
MEERNDGDKLVEIMLPGFRFHPTDEELVGFYLKRKILQRPLSIELIKQLDIYKYDPWDLPKLATTGEKEWYFYCPRDRKYRNSARPNRVTGAGFWKATGTDRPIYSSEGTKCIGLKKSFVFYKGRAAKGVKTDWMMHEFRLPSLTDSLPSKRLLDKSFPANDSWAICRIFKKTSSSAQRALSHSWVSTLQEANPSEMINKASQNSQFSSENICTTTTTTSPIQFCCSTTNNNIQNSSTTANSATFSPPDFVSYKPYQNPILSNGDFTSSFLYSPPETLSTPAKSTVDGPSMLLSMSSMLGDHHHHFESKAPEGIDHFTNGTQEQCNNGFSVALPYDLQGNMDNANSENPMFKNLMSSDQSGYQWETVRSIGFPFGLTLPLPLPLSTVNVGDPWKPNLLWVDSSPCPSELSTNFPATKCYT